MVFDRNCNLLEHVGTSGTRVVHVYVLEYVHVYHGTNVYHGTSMVVTSEWVSK